MNEPSPRPWKTDPNPDWPEDDNDYGVCDSDGNRVASHCDDAYDHHTKITRENADLIVRAVNTHDALVAAVEHLLSKVEDYAIDQEDGYWRQSPVVKAAHAALRLAKGETPEPA